MSRPDYPIYGPPLLKFEREPRLPWTLHTVLFYVTWVAWLGVAAAGIWAVAQ